METLRRHYENNFQARINELEHKLTDLQTKEKDTQLEQVFMRIEILDFVQLVFLASITIRFIAKWKRNKRKTRWSISKWIEKLPRKSSSRIRKEISNITNWINWFTKSRSVFSSIFSWIFLVISIDLDQTANLALNERETQFQEQLQNYQTNLNQAIENSEKVRNELKQIQEENLSKEQQLNEVINQLKQDHEKVQTELNQQGLLSLFCQIH